MIVWFHRLLSSLRLSTRYGAVFVLLFATEVAIALLVHDNFVRPFVGDVLVVILLYCALQTFFALPPRAAVAGVFGFACAIEVGQYFQLAKLLHVDSDPLLRVVLGTHFDALDFVAYASGAAIVLLAERFAGGVAYSG